MRNIETYRITERDLKEIIRETVNECLKNNDLTFSFIKKLNSMSDDVLSQLFEIQGKIKREPIGYGSPLFLERKLNLNEEATESVPLETVRKEILHCYKLQPWQFEIVEHENSIKVGIVAPAIEELPDEIEKDMKTMGYFKSKEEMYVLNNRNYKIMQFEPLFQPNVRDNGAIDGVLIHITPSSNVESIKKRGFLPYSKNSEFDYPNRVHFLLSGFTITEIRRIARGLKATSKNDGDYSMIIVNLFKIPENVKLYFDPNMLNSVFTNEGVPPTAIEKIIPLQIG